MTRRTFTLRSLAAAVAKNFACRKKVERSSIAIEVEVIPLKTGRPIQGGFTLEDAFGAVGSINDRPVSIRDGHGKEEMAETGTIRVDGIETRVVGGGSDDTHRIAVFRMTMRQQPWDRVLTTRGRWERLLCDGKPMIASCDLVGLTNGSSSDRHLYVSRGKPEKQVFQIPAALSEHGGI